jgi:hypothetical protein
VSSASDSILGALLEVARIDDVLAIAGIAVPANSKSPICCPLHAERSPSFYRQQSGKGYRCQGCGAHGGILELATALKLAPTKKDAVKLLADHYRLARGLSGGVVQMRPCSTPITQFQAKAAAPSPSLTIEEHRGLAEAVRGCLPLLGAPA